MSGLIERQPERCRALYNRYVKQAEEKLFEDHVNNHETLCLWSSTLMSHVYITDSDDEESRTCLTASTRRADGNPLQRAFQRFVKW